MALRVVVDSRESDLSNALRSIDFMFENKQLVIGDVMVVRDNASTEEVKCIIERKTVSDLASSIIDGRFKEQKSRIKDSGCDSSCVWYIIEQRYNAKISLPQPTLDSAVLNLQIVHGYKVMYTTSSLHTALVIKSLVAKMQKLDDCTSESSEFFTSKPVFKPVHKQDTFTAHPTACMLSCIPGMSFQTALVIESKYLSIDAICTTLHSDTGIHELAQVQSKRKVGNVLAIRVRDSLFVRPKKQSQVLL